MANLLNRLVDKARDGVRHFKVGFIRLAGTGRRSLPIEYYILANLRFEGALEGFIDGRPIQQIAIDESGIRYRYAGIAPRDCEGRFDVACLRTGEWIVQPGLIYVISNTPRIGNAQR